jgi:subtilisin family serine protease
MKTNWGSRLAGFIGLRGVAMLCLLGSLIWVLTFAQTVQKGDVDGDGDVDAADALLAGKLAIGTVTGNPSQQDAADVSDSCLTVDIRDARHIGQKAQGQVIAFSCLRQLPGNPNDLANNNIPDLAFPEPNPADFHINDDLAISFREVLLMLKSTVTVQQANQLLSSLNAAIIGGLPEGALLLIKVATANLDQMMAILQTLNVDSRVEVALMEMGSAVEGQPTEPKNLPHYNLTPNLWSWEVFPYPNGPFIRGNWGLKMIRAPQMWNLDTFVQRNRTGNQVSAGVVDAGFTDNLAAAGSSTHPDLGKLQIPAGIHADDHGTMVAGIIGATWNNAQGVEGVNPWITAIHGRASVFQVAFATWSRQLTEIIKLIKNEPDVKAINNSYGLSGLYRRIDIFDGGGLNNSFIPGAVNFGDLNGVQPGLGGGGWGPVDLDNPPNGPDTWAQVVARYGRLYNQVVNGFKLLGGRSDFFIVASAGNAGAAYNAVDNSPIANAAIQFGGHFLAVESIHWNNSASIFSDVGGSVSAPGECVRSTETNRITYDTDNDGNPDVVSNFDDEDDTNGDGVPDGNGIADCLSDYNPLTPLIIDPPANWNDWWDGGGAAGAAVDQLYATLSGTSFAAPHVTGLISAIWKLQPNLAVNEVRTLITDAAYTVPTAGGTKPHIDAFAAAMGIDVITIDANKTMQRALVDVDDGTRDGNTRVDPDTNAPDSSFYTIDGLRGDGRVNMRDFRTLRDAFLQACLEDADLNATGHQHDADCPPDTTGDGIPDAIMLDGANAHKKKDLNEDGCANGVPAEVGTLGCNNPPPPLENIYPRFDFNGDGRVNNRRAPINDPAQIVQNKRDLDILASEPQGLPGGVPTPFWEFIEDMDTSTATREQVFEVVGQNLVIVSDEIRAVQVGNADIGEADGNSANDPIVNMTDLLLDRNGDNIPDYLRSADVHLTLDLTNDTLTDVIDMEITSGPKQDAGSICPAAFVKRISYDPNSNYPVVPQGKKVKLLITVPLFTGTAGGEVCVGGVGIDIDPGDFTFNFAQVLSVGQSTDPLDGTIAYGEDQRVTITVP